MQLPNRNGSFINESFQFYTIIVFRAIITEEKLKNTFSESSLNWNLRSENWKGISKRNGSLREFKVEFLVKLAMSVSGLGQCLFDYEDIA